MANDYDLKNDFRKMVEEFDGKKSSDNIAGSVCEMYAIKFLKRQMSASQNPETSEGALPISRVGERSTGRITVSFFRKVYKQFIDEQISMTKMLELMTEQAHRTDVCIRCQRPLDGTNCSKDKCNACFTVNA